MKIGFYDSGLGGAKTLKDIIDMGLKGDIIFLADNKNCPYGIKSIQELEEIIDNNIRYLINKGCKIIVIACNTATSVAIKDLRIKYSDITFIGTEPALKPALEDIHKKIIVLGTTRTINGEKLKELRDKYDDNNTILVALDKLVTLIESNSNEIDEYLKEELIKYNLNDVSHIVLGCTHYPIIKDRINNIVKEYGIKVIDGNNGIGNNLLKLVNNNEKLKITIILSKKDEKLLNNIKEIIKYDTIDAELMRWNI